MTLYFCLIFSCLAVTSQNSLKEEKGEDYWIAVLNKGQQVQSTWKKMCFTLYTLPLWCCAGCTLTQITPTTLILKPSCHPLTTQQKTHIFKILLFRFSVIFDTSAFFFLPYYYHQSCLSPELFPRSPPSSTTSDFPVSSPSSCVLLCFGEISAGNCESFTSCSHNGLWDYAKHSASAALPIDRRQRRPLEHTGKRWRALNEDVTAITQARFTDTLSVCSSSSRIPLPHFLKISFRQSFEVQPHLLQLFHNACPFWICMNSLSRCFCCHLDLQWCVLYSIGYCIMVGWKE